MRPFLRYNFKLKLLKSNVSLNDRRKFSQNVRLFSYKHVCGKYPLIYKTVGKLLDEAAEKFGDRTAFVSIYQDKRITFKEAKEKADALAAGIFDFGIEKGDRVGLWAQNSLEWYITSFALAKAGVISVYLNPSYQPLEIKHCLNAVGVKMLVTAESFKMQNHLEILNEVLPELSKSQPGKLKSSNAPALECVVCISDKSYPGIVSFKDISEKYTENSKKKLLEISKKITPDDSANIEFTSGTSGSPKAAVLSHFSMVNNSYIISKRQNFGEKRHTMCFMGPLFHAMGCVVGILTCLHEGVTFMVPDGSFSASKSASTIVNEKVTILLGTPTMYIDVLKIMKEKDLKPETPEVAITGGAFASSALFNDMLEIMKLKRVASVYGMTESGPVTFMSNVFDDKEKTTTSVGYVMDHAEVKIVDEKGQLVPWNTTGELWVRGYFNMKGYWNNEAKTKEAITPENWLKTGDQFSLSEDGYGKIVGRIKDMIIRGGENIFPSDVEEFLSTHPSILEVQVVGVPDKRLGEHVCACIRRKPDSKVTDEEIKEFCKGKISSFKIPHYVYFVASFPKTSSGKVQKYILRKQAMDHFKLTE